MGVEEVEDWVVFGYWEGDLVVGVDNCGMVTLVEGWTWYVLLGRLRGARDSCTVTDVLSRMIEGLAGGAEEKDTNAGSGCFSLCSAAGCGRRTGGASRAAGGR